MWLMSSICASTQAASAIAMGAGAVAITSASARRRTARPFGAYSVWRATSQTTIPVGSEPALPRAQRTS